MLANTTHPTTSMSSDFFAALATTIDMQEQPQFLADMFGGDISVSGEFERTAYLLARNISDSYNPCGFSFAKCKQYDTFFMYPTDSSKQYAVEDFDEDEDEYDSNDVFGGNNREPFVISEKLPYVRGALISAGDIPPQKTEEIQEAVATLLGISSSKVNVIISDYGG